MNECVGKLGVDTTFKQTLLDDFCVQFDSNMQNQDVCILYYTTTISMVYINV